MPDEDRVKHWSHLIPRVDDLEAAVDDLEAGEAGGLVEVNVQTGVAYELTLDDRNALVLLNNAGAITLTVPANATVAFPVGSVVNLAQAGAGAVTVVGAGGVTVNARGSAVSAGENAGMSLAKTDTDEWYLFGDLAG